MKEVNDYIVKLNEEEAKKHTIPPDNKFYASSALGCERQQVFRRRIPKEFPIEVLKIFQLGNMLHELFQKAIPGEDEAPLSIREGNIVIGGRIDKISADRECYIEFKTTSDLKYTLDKPKEEHVAQLNLYLHTDKAKKGKVVYIDKRNMATSEHEVTYCPELYKKTIENFNRVYESLQTGVLPPVPNGYRFTRYPCYLCSHREECIADLNKIEKQQTL